jgi:hypothetical protein
MARVDAEAGRHFSIFAEDAKVNGYDFQAYLVEKKKFPEALGAIEQIKKEIEDLKNLVSEDVKALMAQKWQWRAMAKKAGIEDEHDYIYAYASKLLHATPASLHTDQKNLEMQEVYLFLRYIYVKILEICDMAYAQPECKLKKVP